MDFVSRLKQYLSTRGISVTQFADECEIPRPTASQLLAGRNKKVSDEIIGKIHYTYPDVSVTWLMFGEGNMASDANIETSEAQKTINLSSQAPQPSEIDEISHGENNLFSSREIHSEKSMPSQKVDDEFSFGDNTFTFSPQSPSSTQSTSTTEKAASTPSQSIQQPTQQQPITVTPGKGKCVTGIVVYYSDSTYESFVPDPEAKHPFMRN